MQTAFPANYRSRQLIQSHIFRPEDLPVEHLFAARAPCLDATLLSILTGGSNYISKSKTLTVFGFIGAGYCCIDKSHPVNSSPSTLRSFHPVSLIGWPSVGKPQISWPELAVVIPNSHSLSFSTVSVLTSRSQREILAVSWMPLRS